MYMGTGKKEKCSYIAVRNRIYIRRSSTQADVIIYKDDGGYMFISYRFI